MYLNDENGHDNECNKNASAAARLCKHFPKNSSFFHNFIYPSERRLCQNLRNCPANCVLGVLKLKKKQKSTLTLQMYCGLHFQFRRAHYH
jgi:hypothetical protein